jgi:hypothetical protein
MPIPLTPEKREELASYLRAGDAQHKAAKKAGVSTHTAWRMARELGLSRVVLKQLRKAKRPSPELQYTRQPKKCRCRSFNTVWQFGRVGEVCLACLRRKEIRCELNSR